MKSYGLTPFLKSPAKHVDVLDYTRGIAILFVLFSHTLGSVNEQFIQTWDSTWEGLFRNLTVPVSSLFPTLFDFGKVGVAIFFVVSGFCIHTSFQQQGQKWRGFFIRRFFRIYPAYLAALIYFVFLYPSNPKLIVHGQTIWIQLLTHLFLVHNLFQDTYTAFNGAFWSLGVEAQLYVLYPVLLFIVAKYGWRRTMVILAGCELLIRGADGLIQTIDATNTVPGQISWLFSASPLGYWFSWSLGAFIADAYLKKQPLPFLNTSLAPWLFLTLMCNFIKPLLPFLFLFSAVTTAIVVCKCLSGRISIIKVPALLLDILKMFGLWSYSIYLLHAPLYQAYSFSIAWFIPDECLSRLLLLLIILISWLAVIPFSILWYKVFELPGIALGKRIIKKSDIRNAATFEPERSREVHRVGRMAFCMMICALFFFVFGNLLITRRWSHPDPVEDNNLAWSYATNPEDGKRNAVLAVKLARIACERTGYSVTIFVGTLAAAYAEAGRFDDAILTAQKACALAEKYGQTNLLQVNQGLLVIYQNHHPFRIPQPDKK